MHNIDITTLKKGTWPAQNDSNQLTFFSLSWVPEFYDIVNTFFFFSCTLNLPCNPLGQKEITVMAIKSLSLMAGLVLTLFTLSMIREKKNKTAKKPPRIVIFITVIFFLVLILVLHFFQNSFPFILLRAKHFYAVFVLYVLL